VRLNEPAPCEDYGGQHVAEVFELKVK